MNPAQWQETEPTIRFNAMLLRPPPHEATESCSFLALPGIVSAKLPSAGSHLVEGTINGFPFRATLEPDGNGRHSLQVNSALQTAAGAAQGELISVEITRVGEEPECRVPSDLREGLATTPAAAKLWMEITPLARRDWILWLTTAKQPETRQTRIGKACSMLAAGKRRVCCFGGLNWLIKDHPATGGTWIDLPRSKVGRSSNRPSSERAVPKHANVSDAGKRASHPFRPTKEAT
jgi:hypothetical protein